MALNTLKCNHLTPLGLKGFIDSEFTSNMCRMMMMMIKTRNEKNMNNKVNRNNVHSICCIIT